MTSRRRLFRQDKRKGGNSETTEKNIGQSKLSNHKLRIVDAFQKRINLADVAIKQQPWKFSQLEALVAGKDRHRG